ncbi:MAG: GNAT family N-acetyltransferase [Oscillospiraceae bacterium]
MEIKKIEKDGYDSAFDLALRVFDKFEAPDYPQEGVMAFRNSLQDKSYVEQLEMYGAYSDGRLEGIIAARNKGSHIALFFVDEKAQGKGIGRKLFEKILENCRTEKLTVNSSPYAKEIYRHLGFKDTDTEQIVDGIRFTPMEFICKI